MLVLFVVYGMGNLLLILMCPLTANLHGDPTLLVEGVRVQDDPSGVAGVEVAREDVQLQRVQVCHG